MRRVIIDSPFAGGWCEACDWKGRSISGVTCPVCRGYSSLETRNIAYARAAMRDCLLRGEAPYASHLLYTQANVLDDNVPKEREHGIQAGFAWRSAADATIVYTDLGISKGMRYGIEHAEKLGTPIEYRTLEGWS